MAALVLTAAMTLHLAVCLDFPRNFIYIGQLYLSCNLADNHSTFLKPNLPWIAEHTYRQFHTVVSKKVYVKIDCKPMIVHYLYEEAALIDLLSIKMKCPGVKKNVLRRETQSQKKTRQDAFSRLF
jgi:predicted protein tyrosine phosphatase